MYDLNAERDKAVDTIQRELETGGFKLKNGYKKRAVQLVEDAMMKPIWDYQQLEHTMDYVLGILQEEKLAMEIE